MFWLGVLVGFIIEPDLDMRSVKLANESNLMGMYDVIVWVVFFVSFWG